MPDTPQSFTRSETAAGTLLVEVTEADTVPGDLTMTPERLLRLMRRRFVAPPGIDIAALLKLVPWPPSAERDAT